MQFFQKGPTENTEVNVPGVDGADHGIYTTRMHGSLMSHSKETNKSSDVRGSNQNFKLLQCVSSLVGVHVCIIVEPAVE